MNRWLLLLVGGWTVFHEVLDGKTKTCTGIGLGRPQSYTALVYNDEYKEIVCEPVDGSIYTILRMKAVAQLMNDLDKNRHVVRYDPDAHWIPE